MDDELWEEFHSTPPANEPKPDKLIRVIDWAWALMIYGIGASLVLFVGWLVVRIFIGAIHVH